MAMYAGDNTPTAATLYGSLGYSPYNKTRPGLPQPQQPTNSPGQVSTGQGMVQPQAPGTGPQISSPPPGGAPPGQMSTGRALMKHNQADLHLKLPQERVTFPRRTKPKHRHRLLN